MVGAGCCCSTTQSQDWSRRKRAVPPHRFFQWPIECHWSYLWLDIDGVLPGNANISECDGEVANGAPDAGVVTGTFPEVGP